MFTSFIEEFKAEVKALATTKLGWFLAGFYVAGGAGEQAVGMVKGFLGL